MSNILSMTSNISNIPVGATRIAVLIFTLLHNLHMITMKIIRFTLARPRFSAKPIYIGRISTAYILTFGSVQSCKYESNLFQNVLLSIIEYEKKYRDATHK